MKRQSGFAVVESIVVLVIVAAIAGVGYYVWNRGQDTSAKTKRSATTSQANNDQNDDVAASLGKGCTAGEMKGKLFTAEKAKYSLCLPDGWNVLVQKGDLLTSDVPGMAYALGTAPKITVTADGGDGATAFALYYNETAAGTPVDYNTVGPFEADNVSGTEYARTETKKQTGLGAVPKGTQQHAYYFENGGKSIEIDYNLLPGDVDHTDAAAVVAKTLIFN